MIEDAERKTRGHRYKLEKRRSRTQLRANFFGNRIVNMWNGLPEEVVTAQSVSSFKGRFDRATSGNRYSMEWGSVTTRREEAD